MVGGGLCRKDPIIEEEKIEEKAEEVEEIIEMAAEVVDEEVKELPVEEKEVTE